MKKSQFFLILFLSIFAKNFADDCQYDCQVNDSCKVLSGYNLNDEVVVKNPYGLSFATNFIYWQPIQENMELGDVSDISNSLDFFNGTIEQLSFDFKPGVQVGLGYEIPKTAWNTTLLYTWLGGSDSVEKSLDPQNLNITIHPFWQFATLLNPQYCYGKETWTFLFNFLDWDLAKKYKVADNVSVNAFTGIRTSFITQKVHVSYKNLNPSLLKIWPDTNIFEKTKGWGIGPRIGTNFDFLLKYDVRFMSRFELDISYFDYTKIYLRQESVNPEIIPRSRYISSETGKGTIRAHYEVALGLGWGKFFANQKWHFDIDAVYSFQLFRSQNVFRNYTNVETISKSISSNGDLYMQGLTVSSRFDF